jgi:hypothetical protein
VRPALVRRSFAAALAAAAVVGGWQSWTHLGHERAHLSAREAERAAAVHEHLPVATFDRWRARVRRGDRWWLDVPEGRAVGLTNRGAVYRAYATFWLLPAVPADSAGDATVVFHLRRAR